MIIRTNLRTFYDKIIITNSIFSTLFIKINIRIKQVVLRFTPQILHFTFVDVRTLDYNNNSYSFTVFNCVLCIGTYLKTDQNKSTYFGHLQRVVDKTLV